jgi:ankyrin repeat protein
MGKKNTKKGKQQVGNQASAQPAEEFDDMLAELRALDLVTGSTGISGAIATMTTGSATIPVGKSSSSSSSSERVEGSSPTEPPPNLAPGAKADVSKEMILAACKRGDVTQLSNWGRQGVRIRNADPLWHAVRLGNLDVVLCLVNDLGADVNQDILKFGATPLYLAAQLGNLDMVRCLGTELGANVNKAMRDGSTPLFIAAQSGNVDMVQCLAIELGAYVNQCDHRDISPLYTAAEMGHLNVVRYLVTEVGADVNKANQNKATPFYIAVQKGHLEVARCLAELGADVNQAVKDGTTPLYMAAQEGYLKVVHFLVKELSVDVNQARTDGVTPLMAASINKHADVTTWLVKAGASPQALYDQSTAAELSEAAGASSEQTAYLEAKAHCSRPDCSGPGLKKCTGCLQARYCGEACQQAHWQAHKADCKRRRAELKAGNVPSSK